jgi:hypothetical protein
LNTLESVEEQNNLIGKNFYITRISQKTPESRDPTDLNFLTTYSTCGCRALVSHLSHVRRHTVTPSMVGSSVLGPFFASARGRFFSCSLSREAAINDPCGTSFSGHAPCGPRSG